MKTINTLLICLLLLSFNIMAQETTTESTSMPTNSLEAVTQSFGQNWYVVATAGTPTLSPKDMTFKSIRNISVGQITVGYKLNDRISIGFGTNSLDNCKSGYYNSEGQFVSLHNDDDDDDDHDDGIDDDHDDGIDDDDDHDGGIDDDDECDDDDDFGDNILGNVTYHLSDNFFVQAAGGYSLNAKAPVYTAMVGYKQDLFGGVGIVAGIRYSDVLRKKPVDATKLVKTNGLKAEVGLSWNF